MLNIKQQWDNFKITWSEKIDKSNAHLFYNFENFIINDLQKFEKRNNNNEIILKEILLLNKPVNSPFIKANTLYIYESSFYMILGEKRYPSALFIENVLSSIIKFIENNSSSTIKITRLYNHNLEDKEEEKEEEEEEEK